ncbi:hypothetical protein [Xylella fastidiosa]|uniref:hypothetical protein n=1 Tax=Xylella fastidiosa TaxID=2371 RepID=UPI0004164B36|nr:hypothetical protein [Xylella fastidiosa]KXB17467.1 hypothetical protein ADT30_00230 [Xylella fastidiosa]
MKKLFLLLLIAVTVLLSACNDGVPKVTDPNHPLDAEGKPISGFEFLKKYCVGKITNEDCIKVSEADKMNSGRGPMPKGW